MFFDHASNFIISGGVFNNINQSQPGFKHLASKAVLSATHDSGESFDRPKCLENTRVAVLKRLKDWFFGEAESENIMWLYGDAGAGKSAIAQTIAEIFAHEKRLLGSFFFSRNDPKRATHNPLVATIAYHAATTIPELKEPIMSAVDRDPRIFDKTLQTQLTTLIIDPLNAVRVRPGQSMPHFLIIDGLDECTDRRIHHHILEVLAEAVRKCHHPLKVLVASRPETEILSTFNSHVLSGVSTRLALDASEFESDDDIHFFLESTFTNIKATHPHRSFIPQSWPSNDVLRELVQKSSGKFIFASTVAKYISSERHRPVERLKIILGLKPPTSDNDLPFAELDALYLHIFSTVPKENLDTVLLILVLSIHPEPMARVSERMWTISSCLSLEFGELEFLLGYLSSILKWDYSPKHGDNSTWTTHASVTDFLMDPRRSKEFHIGQPKFYTQLARICLQSFYVGGFSETRMNLVRYSGERRIQNYLFLNLPLFLERASLTPDLREDISRFSLMSALQIDRSGVPLPFESALRFVCVLGGLPDAQDLFFHHQKEFDACIHLILQKCPPDHETITITTLIGLAHPRWKYTASWGDYYVYDLGGLFFSDCHEHDCTRSPCLLGHDIFKLAMLGGLFSSPQEVQWMLQFFSDTSRSKGYALSGKRYAAASLALLTNICREKFYKAVSNVLDNLGQEFRTLNFGCAYLPQLLLRSSATSELITFLRDRHFERAYANYSSNYYSPNERARFHNFEMEKLIPNVVKAIQNYLERCDPVCTAEPEAGTWSGQCVSILMKAFRSTRACIMVIKPGTRKGSNELLREEKTRETMAHRDRRSGGG